MMGLSQYVKAEWSLRDWRTETALHLPGLHQDGIERVMKSLSGGLRK